MKTEKGWKLTKEYFGVVGMLENFECPHCGKHFATVLEYTGQWDCNYCPVCGWHQEGSGSGGTEKN